MKTRHGQEKLEAGSDFTTGEVIWAVRKEMARTVDDVLARRVRVLYLDARKSIALAPRVAEIMAAELGRDREWVRNQVEEFIERAVGLCDGITFYRQQAIGNRGPIRQLAEKEPDCRGGNSADNDRLQREKHRRKEKSDEKQNQN
ncbi:MAG: glycerol-3-phosphate dehydrogenase C-terminal domain-containing protein [Bacteroidales bacterium]